MYKLDKIILNYITFCEKQKRLDAKTLKAYRIDLRQFVSYTENDFDYACLTATLEAYMSYMHQLYKPKTVKRKIASLKAFFHYLEYKEYVPISPFHKLQIHYREPIVLPKIIPLHTLESLFTFLYEYKDAAQTPFHKKMIIRDIAVLELLFATGIRISELCSLRPADIDLTDHSLLIHGKGNKERFLQIENHDALNALQIYQSTFHKEIQNINFFFINRLGNRLSEQSVRNMINKYTDMAAIKLHITPHMFRHSFATFLLDSDVDIRYIQEMLGHSSINVTEIYTHVAMSKQKHILATKHPRNGMQVGKRGK